VRRPDVALVCVAVAFVAKHCTKRDIVRLMKNTDILARGHAFWFQGAFLRLCSDTFHERVLESEDWRFGTENGPLEDGPANRSSKIYQTGELTVVGFRRRKIGALWSLRFAFAGLSMLWDPLLQLIDTQSASSGI